MKRLCARVAIPRAVGGGWRRGAVIGLACGLLSIPRPAQGEEQYRLDAVADSAWTSGAFAVAAMTEATISTGELEAQLPDDETELLFIDRWVVERDSASTRAAFASDVGVLAAVAWSATDTVLAAAGAREDSGLTYGVLYVESLGTTWLMANLFKLAVRRPRPRAYIELRKYGKVDPKTQEALSFYSLHTAFVATLGATASYLAFRRDGPGWEPWAVLGGSITATGVVGVGRILAGAHFTSDVVAGAAAGTAVGLLVPHLHRVSTSSSPSDVASGRGGPQISFGFAW
jgi:undecaprenyl-diphosphatase